MNWEEKYEGLPFSRKEVDEIGGYLSLPDPKEAYFAAFSISMLLVFYEIQRSAMKRLGSVERVRSKLRKIAVAASALSELLADDQICSNPSQGLWELLGAPPVAKQLDRQPLWKEKDLDLSFVRGIVKNIAISSSELSENDRLLRSYYFLQPVTEAGSNIETTTIWRPLFIIWEQHGMNVAGSASGSNKLHRFIGLVHRAFGLASPNVNTLNRAIQRWKRDPRRHRPENAAWYFGGGGGN